MQGAHRAATGAGRPSAAGRRSALRTDIATELPPVEGDPAQLRQVVLNLVLNGAEAIDDATEGWVAGRIHERECAGAELSGPVPHADLPAGRYAAPGAGANGRQHRGLGGTGGGPATGSGTLTGFRQITSEDLAGIDAVAPGQSGGKGG